ncbi:LCP family protein [Pseudalkalibacillus caeni]|uniref:Transcriptional regulator n=1 Tax=Exobacillus caeni TaxID=2574798 RepID=A0A5R9F493_9BACL|nr:LCP family protein [Pseudalkalibacillus caeni]TLS38502.1 transcriptional regulator [Pseudalkalibacillus caeni]
MSNSRMKTRRKRKRIRRWLKVSILFVILIMFSVVGYGGYLAFTINKTASGSYEELDRGEKSELRYEDVTLGKDPVTILLTGVEDYSGGQGRSDVLILVAINPETKEKTVLSIPRDTRTYIEKIDRKDKITHSYSYGGMDATIQAVQDLLDVPVDYYIETNFDGFEEAVDALGGITLDVPFDFKTYDRDGRWVVFEEGPMEMDGREALAYVRMRKQDPRGDFGRNERQQQAIKAMLEEAVSVGSITKVDNMIESVGRNVKTNISMKELFGMRNFYKELQNKSMDTIDLKGEDAYIDNVYYFVPFEDSIEEASQELKSVLEIEDNDVVQSSDEESDGYSNE